MSRKIKNKILRWCGRNLFPNELRISCLRKSGVRIGEKVYIGEGFTLACDLGYENNLIIEDRVAIAPNVTVIVTSYPNYSYLRNYKKVYDFMEVYGRVEIKHDAWIGAGVIILPNITIGEYAIVGAGSVVTKDVPPKSVVVGNPAKVIKQLDVK